jgi:hypothetical protein
MFPLKPVGLFVHGEKMTSETGSHIRYWSHHHLAGKYYCNRKLLSFEQFDAIDWKSIHQALHDLPRLFQLWMAKHVLGIIGTMKFLSHQDGRSPLCSSCNECKEMCKHITQSPEPGRAAAFAQSTHGVEAWLETNGTHNDLKLLLLCYLQGGGTVTCIECSDNLNLPQIVRDYAISQDVIGWDNFATGMISSKLLPIQSAYNHINGASSHATWWISDLVTQLLQVTHTQWIYRCVLVHNRNTGTLISAHKGELLKEIEHQLALGSESLDEEDRFLIECNFDDLTYTTGEHQEYWLLAIQAAREASCIRSKAGAEQQCNIDTGQRRA